MKEIGKFKVYTLLPEIFFPKRTALLVIDMQNDFCHSKGHFSKYGKDIKNNANVVSPIKRVIDLSRKAGAMIIWAQQTTKPNYLSDSSAWLAFKTRDGKSSEYALEGSWGEQIVPELEPFVDDIIIKKYRNSAFHQTNLNKALRVNGIESVLICGVQTEGCVMATVIEASMNDYYVGILSDCVATTNDELHSAAMKFMAARFHIVHSKQLIEEIWLDTNVSFSYDQTK